MRRAIRDRLAMPSADSVLVSFPKSGRTWVRVMLSRLCTRHFGLDGEEVMEFDNLHARDMRIPRILFTHDGEPWHRPEDLPADKSLYAGKPVLLLVRDPIDVAVSRFFHVNNRSRWIPYPEYKDMKIGEFVWAPLGGIPTIVAYMNNWLRAEGTVGRLLVQKYEDYRTNPEATLAEAAKFLGIPATPEEVAEAVQYAAFENLKKKEQKGEIQNHRLGARQEGNPDSLKVRRGKVKGYLDYFSPEEAERMEKFVRDNLDPRYGYCRSPEGPA